MESFVFLLVIVAKKDALVNERTAKNKNKEASEQDDPSYQNTGILAIARQLHNAHSIRQATEATWTNMIYISMFNRKRLLTGA
jgi:hypothetical protein